MRKVTGSVDVETYKRAKVAVAAKDTFVSAPVRSCLEQLSSAGSEVERLKRQEREIRNRITTFSASKRLSRHEVHDRSL